MIGVIGGSGFIGNALVRALRQAGHEVRIIDRAPSLA
jgi:nucleoside-diphosphate-sugar epimerase